MERAEAPVIVIEIVFKITVVLVLATILVALHFQHRFNQNVLGTFEAQSQFNQTVTEIIKR